MKLHELLLTIPDTTIVIRKNGKRICRLNKRKDDKIKPEIRNSNVAYMRLGLGTIQIELI